MSAVCFWRGNRTTERVTDDELAALGIEDSRRLMGPNLFDMREGAVLDVQLTDDARRTRHLLSAWTQAALRMAEFLGWHDVRTAQREWPGGASLFLTAPVDQLLTATEVAEQAWRRARALVDDADAPDAGQVVAELFAAQDQRALPRLVALASAARARGVTFTYDDAGVSIGSGAASREWTHAALPLVSDVPWAAVRDVPIVLVTGSNGKTTVARMTSAIFAAAGMRVGTCGTDGVFVGGAERERGDYSGPLGARLVLRDPTTEVAVLETARGGMLRRGLAMQHADAAAITTLAADHFGSYGITSLEELAQVKLVVARAIDARGRLVVNAESPVLVDAASQLTVPICWVSRDASLPLLHAHVARGGLAATVRDGRLVLHEHGEWLDLIAADECPATLGGAATHIVTDALIAAALARGPGVPLEAVRSALRNFGADPSDNPGRMMRYNVGGVTVVVDYAHNAESVTALLHATHRLATGRRALVLATGGDRDDAALAALATAAVEAGGADLYIAKDMPRFLRGREQGEMPDRLRDTLIRGGVPAASILTANDDVSAANLAFAWAQPGDLLLLPTHADRDGVLARIAQLSEAGWEAGTPLPV
jgi:cyanophycin synthetase